MSIGAIFLYNIQLNHFLHRDSDENIKYIAYFTELGQSECVYLMINETSNKHVFIWKIWSQCYINT